MPHLPTGFLQIMQWLSDLADVIIAASGHNDGVEMDWLMEVLVKTFEELRDTGPKRYYNTDANLKAPLVATLGQLAAGKQIQIKWQKHIQDGMKAVPIQRCSSRQLI